MESRRTVEGQEDVSFWRKQMESSEKRWRTVLSEVEEEKKELENLCLHLKSRKKGFFRWLKKNKSQVQQQLSGPDPEEKRLQRRTRNLEENNQNLIMAQKSWER